MPAEHLDFPDGTFAHSITNFGIMFLRDAVAGAREMMRCTEPCAPAVSPSSQPAPHLQSILSLGSFQMDRLRILIQHKAAQMAEEHTMPDGQRGVGIP